MNFSTVFLWCEKGCAIIETFFPKNFFSWTNTISFKKSGKIYFLSQYALDLNSLHSDFSYNPYHKLAQSKPNVKEIVRFFDDFIPCHLFLRPVN